MTLLVTIATKPQTFWKYLQWCWLKAVHVVLCITSITQNNFSVVIIFATNATTTWTCTFKRHVTLVIVVIYEHLSAYWRGNEGFAKKVVKKSDDDDDEEEQKRKIATWRQLELMQQRIQTMAGLAAFVSIIVGVLVNELQFRGFVPGATRLP